MGGHHAKVGCIQTGEQETHLGWDLKAGEPAEEELEMVRAWLHDQDLMMDYNGKELPPE